MKNKLFSRIPVLKGKRITLRALTLNDADGLRELTQSDEVYRYLPTILFEKKYDNAEGVIERLYTECINESLILGVFMNDVFCGLAELYGYRESDKKVSAGCRLLPRFWGQGIATEVDDVLIEFFLNETDIEALEASSMTENKASAGVLKKSGFTRAAHTVYEDWGYPEPTLTDKWSLQVAEHKK